MNKYADKVYQTQYYYDIFRTLVQKKCRHNFIFYFWVDIALTAAHVTILI